MFLIFLLIICFFSPITSKEASVTSIIANEKNNVIYFRFYRDRKYNSGKPQRHSVVSMASFIDKLYETGWTMLKVSSSDKYSDNIQAYWSGFLETNATYALTEASWYNTVSGLCSFPLSHQCQKLQKYLSDNLDFTIRSAYELGDKNEFWHQVWLQIWQLKGISDAFNRIFVDNSTVLNKEYLLSLKDDVLGIYLLQLSGELFEICKSLELHGLQRRVGSCHTLLLDHASCSALIKLVKGDVFLSHVTWTDYCQMLRVLKHYNFPWKRTRNSKTRVPGYAISFSSYPSVIFSIDDFYITTANLVTMETTNGNNNDSLWSIVRDGARRSVLEGFRVMSANRLATRGTEWVKYFQTLNSGTYNNQWMIFDAKLYDRRKRKQKKGLLTVAEQIPGRVHSEDVTDVLNRQTYWASYNLPYFPIIYNESGFQGVRERYGDFYDYYKTARAQIFARDHSKVVDLASMYRLMRYNDYKNDPLSSCDCEPPYTGEKAISARSDLNDPDGVNPVPAYKHRLHGGTDVKIVNLTMIHMLNMVAESGPTYDDVPPFDWTTVQVPVKKPLMQPTRWMFKPILADFVHKTKWGAPDYVEVF